MSQKQIEDLTLLLIYLTSFEDKEFSPTVRRSWKGYSFEALNALEEQDFLRGGKGSKSVYITKEGCNEAIALKNQYLPGNARGDSLQQLLNTKSRQELLDYILELAATYDTVEEHLKYKLNSSKQSLEESRALIHYHLRKYGPLDLNNIHFAIKGADVVLENMLEYIGKHEFIFAFQLGRLVIEEILPLFEESINIDFEVELRLNEASEAIRKLCELSALYSEEAEKVYLFDEILKLAQWVNAQSYGNWQDVLFEGCNYLEASRSE